MSFVLTPRVSEKAYQAAGVENGVYTFIVPMSVNKHEIKSAVEKLYEVSVVDVNISVLKGKIKRFSQKRGRSSTGKRSDIKKAYVSLKTGDKIPVFNPEADKDSTPSTVKGNK